MAVRDRKNRAQYAFVPGQPVVFKIPERGKVFAGHIILRGTVHVTGGTTNGTLIDEGGPLGLIRHITITANRLSTSRYPGNKIVDCTPRALIRYAAIQRQGKHMIELSGSTLGGGAIADYPIYLSIPVYFADAQQWGQSATALNMDPGTYESVQVQIDTAADLTGCFSGNDRSIAGSTLWVEWVDDRLALAGDCTPIYQEDHFLQIGAATERLQDPAMPTDGSFLQMYFFAEQGAQRTLSDAILNRMVFEGVGGAFNMKANDIRQGMFDDEWLDPSTTATGQYFVDWTDGLQQFNNFPAPGALMQFDVNNPSGANADSLRVYTRRVFPLLPAAA
jgi:hypothetical protein